MCGISGFWQDKLHSREWMLAQINAMNDTLAKRGPDDRGVWTDAKQGVALGNRRLAILDLSPAGHQPMESSCGRYVLAYNGEVYNFREIRKKLDCRFRSFTDTEVILEGCAKWGILDTLQMLNGMFSFALWDRRDSVLTLARDRIGIKPLYYGKRQGTLFFGSELKALCAHPDFVREVDRDSLTLLLRHNYIPYPHSIYRGVYKLPPGHLLQISPKGECEPTPYWSAREVVEYGSNYPFTTVDEAADRLDELLGDAVTARMISDVPLGAFLSGGIDSSTVVAFMQAHSSRPVKTFSIGFDEADYDEAPYAKKVADYLGTEHTELYMTPKEAREVIPTLAEMYDEPFSDSSQIPTSLLAKLAAKHVTVCLSGDGGDELFAGYNRYFLGQHLWQRITKMPMPLRKLASHGISAVPSRYWDMLLRIAGPFLPEKFKVRLGGEKVHKLAEIMKFDSACAMYRQLVSHWTKPDALVIGAKEPPTPLRSGNPATDFVLSMMYWDLISYLPCDILTKVDRATMAFGLEARVPLLDHRVVEFSWRLPLSMKKRDGCNKWLLRQVLYRYLPPSLVKRPKMGFGVPIGAWMRGPLRPWAESLLSESRLRREGFFHPRPIREKWNEHLSGKRDWQYLLWDVLMFQMWQERWL